jgi:hypothetical protein
VTEPRNLTDLVPADVQTELAAAVAALELHGPAVTKALRRLDRATTAAWNAVNPAHPTQDEGGSSSAPSVSTVAGMPPISWSPPSTRPGRATHQPNA